MDRSLKQLFMVAVYIFLVGVGAWILLFTDDALRLFSQNPQMWARISGAALAAFALIYLPTYFGVQTERALYMATLAAAINSVTAVLVDMSSPWLWLPILGGIAVGATALKKLFIDKPE